MTYHRVGSVVKIVGSVRDKYSKRQGIQLPPTGKVTGGSTTDDGMYVEFNQENGHPLRIFVKSQDLESVNAGD